MPPVLLKINFPICFKWIHNMINKTDDQQHDTQKKL